MEVKGYKAILQESFGVAKQSLLAKDYPSSEEWKQLVNVFAPEAVAYKLLLATIPYVFHQEPVKYSLFRKTIADFFQVSPTDVFIVGSALAGRSLKGSAIDKPFSPESDIDTIIVSEHLFAKYVMRSFEWIKDVTSSQAARGESYKPPVLTEETTTQIGKLSMNACKGIWRPDSLPQGAAAREEFFTCFSQASLPVLGLQLSEDTVAKVNGRIARSFDDAVRDLSQSILRLRKELQDLEDRGRRLSQRPAVTESRLGMIIIPKACRTDRLRQ